MGMKSLVVKGMLIKTIGGGLGFAVLHAIIFWVAFFQCGGFQNFWQWISSTHSVWFTLVEWLSFPLGYIKSSDGVYVLLMIVNSLLWGTVIGILCGLIFRKKL